MSRGGEFGQVEASEQRSQVVCDAGLKAICAPSIRENDEGKNNPGNDIKKIEKKDGQKDRKIVRTGQKTRTMRAWLIA